MFPVILLAGGQSSRMGEPKGLVSVRGKSWLELQLEALAAAGVKSAVVVLGHGADAYRAKLPWLRDAGVVRGGVALSVVANPKPELGQFSSLQIGVRQVLAVPAAFVLPIDVPAAEPFVWSSLVSALTGAVRVCIPELGERGGHPVLLSQSFIQELAVALPDTPESRLDAWIHREPLSRVARVAVTDRRVTMNMNEPADWKQLG
jgi:molybdenum cofactor cytidylyltransferase